MKAQEYAEIVSTIRKFQGLTRDCARMLIEKYNRYQPNTLYSILTQEMQQKMKTTNWRIFRKDVDYYDIYLQAVQRGEPIGILMKLAIQLNTCPALLAKNVLETYLKTDENNGTNKNKISKLMRNTALIPDGRLAYEIYLCILYDTQYGPISTAISEAIGKEYEVKLEIYLKERNVSYHDETYLRKKGYDKTPDCKLEIPIAVNGYVINWIESKAQFGSPDTHQTYIKKQFLSYWNRFGPGLVIYWFGFVDTIAQTNETRFIVMDHFPTDITYMDPYCLLPPNYEMSEDSSKQTSAVLDSDSVK